MKLLKSSLLILFILLPGQVLAKDEIFTGFWDNLAVSGYDPVAYFTESKPVEGKSKYSYEYKGAEWRFSSQEDLDKFVANPEKNAPQYGGYCAWAVAHNTTAKTDPTQWTIVDDKLYLNYDADIQSRWVKDKPKYIKQADTNWPGVL